MKNYLGQKAVICNMKTIKNIFCIFIAVIALSLTACSQEKKDNKAIKQTTENPKYNKLTKEEERVIIHKGTEAPYSGKYTDNKQKGTYTCKRCNALLYKSDTKFDSNCGWPSFDEEIKGAVIRVPDMDGQRTEIICANCKGHLGHVFLGEGFTSKNTRHCVNSISMNFIPEKG